MDFQSSFSFEALLQGSHLDVQSLFYQQLLQGDILRRVLQLIKMEEWKSLVAGLPWWGGREGGAILTNLWLPM